MTTESIPREPLGPQMVIPTNKRPAIASPIGWSSIFVAAVVAAGIWLVLHLIGVGIGLTAIDPSDGDSLKAVGIGTGIWALIAPLIALFIGGLVAGRTAPTLNTWNAIIHATAAWALAAISALVLIAMMLGAVVRTAASTAGAAATVAAKAGDKLGDTLGDAPGALGIDSQDVVAGVNRRLAEKGLPPVSAADLKTIANEAAQRTLRGDKVDRQALVEIAAQQTRLTRPQAEQVATELEGQINQLKQRGGEIVQQGQEKALQVAEGVGGVMLGLSITMLLGLAAAIVGSVITVSRERRDYTGNRDRDRDRDRERVIVRDDDMPPPPSMP